MTSRNFWGIGILDRIRVGKLLHHNSHRLCRVTASFWDELLLRFACQNTLGVPDEKRHAIRTNLHRAEFIPFAGFSPTANDLRINAIARDCGRWLLED